MLQADSRPDCYIEVKSVTLAENEQGYFPDAVTERGQKHLRELMSVAAEGQRAVIFFCRAAFSHYTVFHPRATSMRNTRNYCQKLNRGG